MSGTTGPGPVVLYDAMSLTLDNMAVEPPINVGGVGGQEPRIRIDKLARLHYAADLLVNVGEPSGQAFGKHLVVHGFILEVLDHGPLFGLYRVPCNTGGAILGAFGQKLAQCRQPGGYLSLELLLVVNGPFGSFKFKIEAGILNRLPLICA